MGLFKAWLNEVTVDCPNGIFVKALPTTDSVVAIKQRFKHYADLREDLHVTVIFSKTPAHSIDLPKVDRDERYQATSHGLDWWEGHDKDGYLVLRLTSPSLNRLNKRFTDAGLVPTFPDYKAHMTLLTPCKVKPITMAMDIEQLQKDPLEIELYYGGYTIMDAKS